MKNCTALIVAAGAGDRFGGPVPKQYLDLGGISILRRSVLAFLEHPLVDAVQVVFNPVHRERYDKAVGDLNLPEPITGGKTRQDSVRLGLEALAKKQKPEFVLIHDAARPLIDAATITAVRKALDHEAGAIAAKPLVDTLKRGAIESPSPLGGEGLGWGVSQGENVESGETTPHQQKLRLSKKAKPKFLQPPPQGGRRFSPDLPIIETTIDRKNLWQAHTPQGFRFEEILKAHQAAQGAQLTDDAAVAEKAGLRVSLISSNPDNMKITNPDDLDRAARLLGHALGDVRTGFGYDVHRLVPGDKIFICGVAIPHNRKLEGHSDADVGLHAIVDAILGALGAGDIGVHFPPSDPQWKGKDSAHFVQHAVNMVHERGGVIAHVDVTLICEAPKIGPHRPAMLARLAELLEVTPDRVSVKATTTERLGFLGREEGIAAQAVATVRLGS